MQKIHVFANIFFTLKFLNGKFPNGNFLTENYQAMTQHVYHCAVFPMSHRDYNVIPSIPPSLLTFCGVRSLSFRVIMSVFEDVRVDLAPGGGLSVKLCRINGKDFFDFRHINTNFMPHTPTKNGICMKKEFLNDFIHALGDLLLGTEEKTVGPATLIRKTGYVRITKGTKVCAMNFDDIDYVRQILELFQEGEDLPA